MNFKNIKRSVCAECKRRPEQGIPLKRCAECKIKFCFDHINHCQYSEIRMTINDEVRNVCVECSEKFRYKGLG